jgi:hypothetical protein
MRLTFSIKNAKIVRQGLEDLEAEVPKIGRRQIYSAMNRITREMESYPPERPGQLYVRTGKLGFSWYVDRRDDGYVIRNTAKDKRGRAYGKYVVGDAYGLHQAWMHKNRWPLFRDVADNEIERLPERIANEISMVERRIFDGGAVQ